MSNVLPQTETDATGNSHGRRVAVLAREIGRATGMKAADLELLERVALYRHDYEPLLAGQAMTRLLAEVLPSGSFAMHPAAPLPARFRVPVDEDGSTRFAEIIDVAEAVNAAAEGEVYDEEAWDETLARVGISHLRRATLDDLRATVHRLPVFPTVVVRNLEKLMRDDVSDPELERIAAQDPVVAADLIASANSALYGARLPIRSVHHAVHYIGREAAIQVLIAAMIRPLYRGAALRRSWMHALHAADAASSLARMVAGIGEGELALAGLVHDIGVLAMAIMNDEVVDCCERLAEGGCPQMVAERIVCGFDHAEAGGEILKLWGFPTDLAEAVAMHHRPEVSQDPVAALLYLTEFCCCSEEDLPSNVRLACALRSAGLTREQVIGLREASAFRRLAGA